MIQEARLRQLLADGEGLQVEFRRCRDVYVGVTTQLRILLACFGSHVTERRCKRMSVLEGRCHDS